MSCILNSNMEKLFFNGDLALKNIRFIVGTIKVSCTDYDSVTHQYVTRFTVDSFSNFNNNTLAFIPISCFNELYSNNIINISIYDNWVTIASDISTDSVVVSVLMIQYNI